MPLVYLTGKINEHTDDIKFHHQQNVPLGMLVQPLTVDYLEKAALYTWVGIDNGCFSEIGRRKFVFMDYLNLIEHALNMAKLDGVLFAVAPDEPFNWEATLRKSLPVLPKITAIGNAFYQRVVDAPILAKGGTVNSKYPHYNIAAICVQNGATPDTVPWDLIGTVFIGGDNEFKLGPAAHAIVKEAQRRHKHVHMGRVNSMKRMLLCQSWGVDSADGTYLRFTDPGDGTHNIMEWLRENWRRYHCCHCGIINPFCICSGEVECLTREEIDARYAIPSGLTTKGARLFIQRHIAKKKAS